MRVRPTSQLATLALIATGALLVPAASAGADPAPASGGGSGSPADERRLRRRGQLRRPDRDQGGPAGAEDGRQRGGRRDRHGCSAGRHRAVQLGSRRGRVPFYYNAKTATVKTIDGRDRARRDHARRLHRPRRGQALQLRAETGDERRLRRGARHPGHLGQGAAALGDVALRPGAGPGDQGGRPRLPGRHDLQPADGGEPAAVRGVPVHQRDLPAGRPAAGRGLDPEEPRPRRHLPVAGRQGGQALLLGQAGAPGRRGRPQAPEVGDHHPARTSRLDDAGRPPGVSGAQPQADPGGLPRVRRLRHGAVLQRRLDGGRGAQHHGALRPGRHERHRRAAPLPGGLGPRVRRPRRVHQGPSYVDVPLSSLLDDSFAAERACKISETAAFTPPVAAGNPASYDGSCATPAPGAGRAADDTENLNTTNLTVSDRWGNVVEYTLTIEQTGGSGIVVPGRGFLLDDKLTDFSAVWWRATPTGSSPASGRAPRSRRPSC